ncbi:MAG TPA: hypothetical protein VFM54_22885 [Micromonosporaceae bacterium]|nr:hypothetical protein [Micromonosporaceae bacterium]
MAEALRTVLAAAGVFAGTDVDDLVMPVVFVAVRLAVIAQSGVASQPL